MLTFYPEFEVDNITDNEIIILLDLSNSMKVISITCSAVLMVSLYCSWAHEVDSSNTL